jgi:hypothetical protein
MAFSIDNKVSNRHSDLGAISLTIYSAHIKPFRIANAIANILSD